MLKPLLVILLLIAAPLTATEPRRPNVIVILTDDQGWGDLSLHGNTNLHTPHIDALARSGAQFRHFFVQPVCSPTRAEFLTGRYHPRGGVVGVSTGGERLNLNEKTIADSFLAAGYSTGCFGKWHNGSQYPYHPNGRGFQEYYGFTSGHWGDYYSPPLDHNGTTVRGEGFLADDLTSKAIAFATAKRAGPFFCYLAYNTPHSPMQVPDEYWNRFKTATMKLRGTPGEDLEHSRAALAMCENLDANIGRLLAALDTAKLAEDTIVVYFHDNGPNGRRWNGGLKGIKGSTDEGGTRSPLFVRWPGRIKPESTISTIAGAIDILPTLTDLTDVKRIGDQPLDGISFASALLGTSTTEPSRYLFQYWNGKLSVRSQTHRLDSAGQLFDMVNDPGQSKNIAAVDGKLATDLQNAAADWKRDVLKTVTKKDDRPFPVGATEFPRTVLPARDGVPHGRIRRSANAPNCSYFTHWTAPADAMTWAIEVTTDGTYRAIVHYTCPPDDVGSNIVLNIHDSTWRGTVAVDHDPKPFGKEHDRVPRVSESDMKEFRPLDCGETTLAKGRGTLTLKADKIVGKTVADILAVELVLVTPLAK